MIQTLFLRKEYVKIMVTTKSDQKPREPAVFAVSLYRYCGLPWFSMYVTNKMARISLLIIMKTQMRMLMRNHAFNLIEAAIPTE